MFPTGDEQINHVENWIDTLDPSTGNTYYYNRLTRVTQVRFTEIQHDGFHTDLRKTNMMDFALKIGGFSRKTIDFSLKIGGISRKTIDFVWKLEVYCTENDWFCRSVGGQFSVEMKILQ